MKNLKRTLALVLAVVMCIGFAAMASAAFSDAEDIKYPEAVDVLSSIGVINGYDDGTFKPEGTLTRAQAAKIIAYLVGADGITGTAPFDDCKGHWAESNIAYCASEGIVNGVGDNKFNPEGTLTGYAFAKMCLGILGYSAKTEGMEGSGWEINVAKLIKSTGLTAGIAGFDGTANITREEACQIALNMLQTKTVEYEGGTTSTIIANGVEITTTVGGTLKEGDPFMKEYFPKLKKTTAAADEYGRPSTEWTNSGKEIGTYPMEAAQTIIVPAGYNKKVADLLKTNKLTLADDYNGIVKPTDDALPGQVAEIFLNEDGEVSAIAGYYYMAFQIVGVKTLKSTTTLGKAGATAQYTLEPNPGFTVVDKLDKATANTIAIGDWEEGDVVAYKFPATGDDPLAGEVFEPELVEGKFSAFNMAKYTMTMGGQEYGMTPYTYTASAPDFKTEYQVYLDPNGFALYITTEAAAEVNIDDIVYVVAEPYSSVDAEGEIIYFVKTVNMKGEYKLIKTAVDPRTVVTDADFYVYDSAKGTFKSDLGSSIYDTTATGAVTPSTKSVTDSYGDKTYLATDIKYIFLAENADHSFKSATAYDSVTYTFNDDIMLEVEDESGNYLAKVIIVWGKYEEAADSEVIFLTGKTTGVVTADGAEYEAYTLEGDATTIVLEPDSYGTGFFEYTTDKDGVSTIVGPATITSAFAAKDGIYGHYYVNHYGDVSIYNSIINIKSDVADADLAANVEIVDVDDLGYGSVSDLTEPEDYLDLVLVVSGKKIVTIFVFED